MTDITSLIRLRIGAHDAHYAGGLVDGAKMLQLFGDVATELLIRSDGDEGLFVAYDSVEFLAPVHAGDYIEATGRIVSMGKTSRKMVFEARKVIASARWPARLRPPTCWPSRCWCAARRAPAWCPLRASARPR
jgi:3-aminobutyryl-CoA ammonia-lyase